ncbi:TPA: gamma-glutamyl-gamma-aminobutyrate hydrolase family protein [Enterococcus faecium]
MKNPIIGISGSIIVDREGMFPGYKRSFVNEDYISSVLKNGGIPVVIPVNQEEKVIEQQVEQIDGLILTGGYDISPEKYHEEPLQKLGDTLLERDNFDFLLLKKAKEKNLPILGICRGSQLINVYHGGSLYQDLSYRKENTLKHWQGHDPDKVTHTVDIDKNSKIYEILRCSEIQVNSFHHQLIKDVPNNFMISARAKDGVVEAIEATNYGFLIGIQWHPEMLHKTTLVMNELFKQLIVHSAGEVNV